MAAPGFLPASHGYGNRRWHWDAPATWERGRGGGGTILRAEGLQRILPQPRGTRLWEPGKVVLAAGSPSHLVSPPGSTQDPDTPLQLRCPYPGPGGWDSGTGVPPRESSEQPRPVMGAATAPSPATQPCHRHGRHPQPPVAAIGTSSSPAASRCWVAAGWVPPGKQGTRAGCLQPISRCGRAARQGRGSGGGRAPPHLSRFILDGDVSSGPLSARLRPPAPPPAFLCAAGPGAGG